MMTSPVENLQNVLIILNFLALFSLPQLKKKKFKSVFESPREPPAWAFLDHFSKTFNSLPVLLVSVSFGKES